MLTSPHHCPHCRCWGGLAVKPQLSSCVQTAQISARVQMRWGHPQCQGRLRGDSQPRMVLGEVSALLTQQLFLLSQQVQPPAGSVCWGGHPPPPGPRSQLRGHRAGGDIPNNPKSAPHCRARDLLRPWGSLRLLPFLTSGLGVPSSTRGSCLPPPPPLPPSQGSSVASPCPPARGPLGLGKEGLETTGEAEGWNPCQVCNYSPAEASQAKPEPRGEQGRERPSASTTVCPGPAPSGWMQGIGTGVLIPRLWYGWSAAGLYPGCEHLCRLLGSSDESLQAPVSCLCPVSAASPALPAGTLHPCSPSG